MHHKVALAVFPILILVLSCEGISTNAPTPLPTPITATIERIIRDYKANPILGKDLYHGKVARVTGVRYSIEETRSGYELVLGTGEADSLNVIVCEASQPSYESIGDAIEVHGTIQGNSVNKITIEDCHPYSGAPDIVQSWVIRVEGRQPSSNEIEGACEVLAEAGYKIADDNKWTPAEERIISRAALALGHTSDMTLAILSAIIKVEGENASRWCRAR